MTTTTPAQRIKLLISEGARLVLIPPGQVGIDLTSDLVALLNDRPKRRHEPPRIPIKVRRPACVLNPPGPGVPIDLANLSKHASPCANTVQESS